MALMVLAIVLGAACLLIASFIKRTRTPVPGSMLYVTVQALYFIGWGWAVLVAMLLLVLLITTMHP